MLLIREIVQQALATGYLTIAAQEQRRQLLQTFRAVGDCDRFEIVYFQARNVLIDTVMSTRKETVIDNKQLRHIHVLAQQLFEVAIAFPISPIYMKL